VNHVDKHVVTHYPPGLPLGDPTLLLTAVNCFCASPELARVELPEELAAHESTMSTVPLRLKTLVFILDLALKNVLV
jgi:hypothetical protein